MSNHNEVPRHKRNEVARMLATQIAHQIAHSLKDEHCKRLLDAKEELMEAQKKFSQITYEMVQELRF